MKKWLCAGFLLTLLVANRQAPAMDYRAWGLRSADYLLAQQNADGAIPDAPGWDSVNTDSNMEYALIGLAAAYRASAQARYLAGLEQGIHWLAGRAEMDDPRWRGSWFYAYSAAPPYAPLPTSPGDPAIADVRGVDATSALFAYLLYLHTAVSGSDALARQYEPQARAALDFILAYNRSPDGFFYSSWQRRKADGQWRLWKYRYTADQADVYLGLWAGWQLYQDERYAAAAQLLRQALPQAFFDPAQGRYALGVEEDGSLEMNLDGFDGIFPQGYLPWVSGDTPANRAAANWLAGCAQADGSLACSPQDPRFSLSAAIYALSASALDRPRPGITLDWLTAAPYDQQDGGIRDTAALQSEKFPNVAGFSATALLEFPAWPPLPAPFYPHKVYLPCVF